MDASTMSRWSFRSHRSRDPDWLTARSLQPLSDTRKIGADPSCIAGSSRRPAGLYTCKLPKQRENELAAARFMSEVLLG